MAFIKLTYMLLEKFLMLFGPTDCASYSESSMYVQTVCSFSNVEMRINVNPLHIFGYVCRLLLEQISFWLKTTNAIWVIQTGDVEVYSNEKKTFKPLLNPMDPFVPTFNLHKNNR